MHLARLATEGANSIKLTYSSLGPILSDFDKGKGNLGQFGGPLLIFGLGEAPAYARICRIEERCENKMTAVSQLYRKTQLLESFIHVVFDRHFVHSGPISLWTVKMEDRKYPRMRNARVHSKKILWQIDFLRFGTCALYIVLFGTSTLLVPLYIISLAYMELVDAGKEVKNL